MEMPKVEDPNAEDEPQIECTACNSSEVMVLGTLGKRRAFRCRQCGWEFGQVTKVVS